MFSLLLIYAQVLFFIYIIPRLLLLLPNITKAISKPNFMYLALFVRCFALFLIIKALPYINSLFVENEQMWSVFLAILSAFLIVYDTIYGDRGYIDAEYKKSSK